MRVHSTPIFLPRRRRRGLGTSLLRPLRPRGRQQLNLANQKALLVHKLIIIGPIIQKGG